LDKISHTFPDGSERTINCLCFLHTNKCRKNYAQIKRETLALIFGVEKFHRYLCGHNFILITDQKPLAAIMGPKRGIPSCMFKEMGNFVSIDVTCCLMFGIIKLKRVLSLRFRKSLGAKFVVA